jgi:thiol-disulfide isomerase/thioredoxin
VRSNSLERKNRLSSFVPSIALALTLSGTVVGWEFFVSAHPPREAARSFTVRTLDGRSLRLAELRGRPVVLDFWATWCAPCRASMPHLSAMQDRFGRKGLVVLGLSVDDVAPEQVRRFAARLRVHFPVAMATESVLDNYGPIRSIPTTIFIDRQGRILRRVVGYVDEETLEGFIREIL